ncbi:MAG: hypothetical protein C0404_12825 [Verrucomicrobia bacterium]|nr:hypothetical protein [Verrucomicrobiota bacterium]
MDLLVIDDDPSIRRLLSFLFTRAGVDHVIADGPAEARRICQSQKPKLVISDVDMPGTSGVELAPVLRRLCPGVIIWAFTGSSGDPHMKESSRVFDRVFSKSEHKSLVDEAVQFLAESRHCVECCT